ncbi:hypothetical protein H261_00505 [Paramagnetospirillum caucaseum]|uniref:Tyr recombinase domain-containing protein n=1 Tax=Paramagnetospirillum caucaseum TaxID=1244869 RepID=M3AHI3_9PROT|nr:site-specific integrase [Paramagnetospirillum caucaseum]EME72014.1 hypothetical protein H261_00505 [Paramagnetospirillum caucaseum]
MDASGYIKVIDGVYIYSRENAVTGIWHYYFKIGKRVFRKSTATTDINKAKIVAIHQFQEATINIDKVPAIAAAPAPAKTVSFKMVANRWLNTRREENDFERNNKVVTSYLIPFFDGVLKMKDISTITQSQINDYILWRRYYRVTGDGSKQTMNIYQRGGRQVKAEVVQYGALADSTLNRENITLNHIIKFAMSEGVVNPSALINVPRFKVEDDNRPHFTEQQADKLCHLARDRTKVKNTRNQRERRMVYNFAILLRYTGMRPGELLSVRWGDVDDKARIINLPGTKGANKTGKRKVPLLFKEAIDQIHQMRQDRRDELDGNEPKSGEHLFLKTDGTRIESLKTAFSNLVEACDFEPSKKGDFLSPYSFRHTFITQMCRSRAPIALTAKALGTSVEMIQKYYDHNITDDILMWMDTAKAEAPAPVQAPAPKSSGMLNLEFGTGGAYIEFGNDGVGVIRRD